MTEWVLIERPLRLAARAAARWTRSSAADTHGLSVPISPMIPGITPLELTVGRALQRYGAYCGDNGGSRMSFLFEYEGGTSPGPTYRAAGAGWDYFDMVRLPWSRLRVLKAWNGQG